VSEDGLKASIAKYANVIAGQGGEVTALEGWGKRRLAYEIEDHADGHYFLYKFRGGNNVIDEYARQLRIRHMIVLDDLAGGDEPTLDPNNLEPSKRTEPEEVSRGEAK
jgi:small subunit ribosomal protein S6